MGGFWKPLDHEKSAQKDKLQKKAYQENFAGPAQQKLPSGLSELGWQLKGKHLVTTPTFFNLQTREMKAALRRELRRITNRFPILIAERQFAFKWKCTVFAEANGLARTDAESIFPKIKAEAEELRSMVERRILRLEIIQTAAGREMTYDIAELTSLLKFANGFKIEDEFFRSAPEK